ncbi:MAG: hypothetical protein RL072_1075, partial [Actinomycetota bacterium]
MGYATLEGVTLTLFDATREQIGEV